MATEVVEAFALGYALYSESLSPRAERSLQFFDSLKAPSMLDVLIAEAEGTKEGLYHKLYLRRDRLHSRQRHEILNLTRRFTALVNVPHLVGECRSAYRTANEATKKDHDAVKAAALAVLLSKLNEYHELSVSARNLAALARAQGAAEGTIAAAALLEQTAGKAIPNIEALYKSTLANLQKLDDYWTGVDSIVTDQIAGLAGDLGPTIAKLLSENATQEQLEKAVSDILGSAQGAEFYLDLAVQTAFIQAQLAYYRQTGINSLNFVTQGDAHVCPLCIAAEDGNSYSLDSVPVPPIHGDCRCFLEPA